MNQLAHMAIVNWQAFAKGLADAQKKKQKYMTGELKRAAKRIAKKFIREQLHGPPGIDAGKLAKGKNIWTYVHANDGVDSLYADIGISRILHVHEKGLTIHAKNADGKLYLREKGTGPRKNRPIIAVVPQVKIPPRLKFEQLVHQESPGELRKVAQAGARGVEVALKTALGKAVKRNL